MPKKYLSTMLRLLSLLFVIGVSVCIYIMHDKAKEFGIYGYPGIFIIALLANATVLLPAPGLAVVFTMGSVFHPLGVALAAGTGGALGEFTGYIAGFSGQPVIERMDIYRRITPWVQKYGYFAIFILAAIPNPFFDLAGIASGVIKMPVGRFLIACWTGQIIKMLVFAYAGSWSLQWLLK